MSLLIKALNKAEEVQAQNAKTEQSQAEKGRAKNEVKAETNVESDLNLELSLSPNTNKLKESAYAPITQASVEALNSKTPSSKISSSKTSNSVSFSSPVSKVITTSSSTSAASAANVFSSKGVDASKQNTTLALIAGVGLIALLAMGLYYYQFANNTLDVVIPPRPLAMAQAQPQPSPENNVALPPQITALPVAEAPDDTATQLLETQAAPITEMAKKPIASDKPALTDKPSLGANEDVLVAENETVMDETMLAAKANKKNRKSQSHQLGESTYSPNASMKVSKTKSESAGVNPVLMSAYEAYNAGDDANAQKLYKQVLQRDVRNVDALLGLGAIATRQGRDADANGWFAKVLELDPRNSMAQAALLDTQPQGSEANSESRIKNMLAKHPNDPNLHVALGNFYAEQNQWLAAQQSYFDAYSLNTSADNAFNLAVSLDQMGKPKLALPYYQRALEQASSTSSIDKAALEARIAAIQ